MNQQELLQFAIQGLEMERSRIDGLLAELRGQVHGSPVVVAKPAAKGTKGRTMSAAGRANIRAALKRRWAAFHAGKGAAPNAGAVAKKKRTLTKAQLEAMRRNAAKARAAIKAAR
jgi:hypothetical protein